MNTNIRSKIFINHDVNLFIVDWSGPAGNINYPRAKLATNDVGQIIASFINAIHSKYRIDGSKFTLIGHSLGAHTVGIAGKHITKKVEHIIGLDPAGPGYSNEIQSKRLDANDAKFVQVIHTNTIALGIFKSIGHVDIYPNGGEIQPGCGIIPVCSHERSYEFLAEALARGSVFKARLCSSYVAFLSGFCNGNVVYNMGILRPNIR